MPMIRCARRVVWLLAMTCSPALAQSPAPLPAFNVCMDIQLARYERAFSRLRNQAGRNPVHAILRVEDVEYCGNVGIVRCDRSDAPLPCQKALADQQEVMRANVLGQLPAPAGLSDETGFSARLYTRIWALAHGVSAGPDCAGSTEVMRSWCEAREANGRLHLAIQAWQMARHLGLASPAIEAGWAASPPPIRPRLRPGGKL